MSTTHQKLSLGMVEGEEELHSKLLPCTCMTQKNYRACPGSHIALDMLFLIIASTLSVFNIENALDKSGSPIVPKIEWHCGLIRLVIYPHFICS